MSNPIWTAKIDLRPKGGNLLVELVLLIMSVLELLVGIRKKGTLDEYENRIELNRQNFLIWFWKNSATTTIIQKKNVI